MLTASITWSVPALTVTLPQYPATPEPESVVSPLPTLVIVLPPLSPPEYVVLWLLPPTVRLTALPPVSASAMLPTPWPIKPPR